MGTHKRFLTDGTRVQYQLVCLAAELPGNATVTLATHKGFLENAGSARCRPTVWPLASTAVTPKESYPVKSETAH